jgi:hypothetical protein
MKNLLVFTVACVAMSLLACQDTKEEPGTATVHDISAYKKIGTRISYETGTRWMDAYNQKNNIQGRLGITPYALSASQLQTAMQSVSNLVGVAFQHAIDDEGTHHFIVIPIDSSLSVWSSIPGRIYIDANSNTEISRNVARSWAQHYEEENADGIWFHFFGSNIFAEISAISYFSTLDIVPALNDLDLTPQLLLVIRNEQLNITGRSAEDDEPLVYDASSPCPPCPVQ